MVTVEIGEITESLNLRWIRTSGTVTKTHVMRHSLGGHVADFTIASDGKEVRATVLRELYANVQDILHLGAKVSVKGTVRIRDGREHFIILLCEEIGLPQE